MEKILKDIMEKVEKINGKHPTYNSPHEAYAILLEEVDEVWDEVKIKDQNYTRMYNEVSDVACVCIRFMKFLEEIKKEKGVIT